MAFSFFQDKTELYGKDWSQLPVFNDIMTVIATSLSIKSTVFVSGSGGFYFLFWRVSIISRFWVCES